MRSAVLYYVCIVLLQNTWLVLAILQVEVLVWSKFLPQSLLEAESPAEVLYILYTNQTTLLVMLRSFCCCVELMSNISHLIAKDFTSQ
jgi:hypothetical protein